MHINFKDDDCEMELMFTTDEFYRRFTVYKKIDYANSYYNFWRRKITIESDGSHILDNIHFSETFNLLGPILRAWQTYRPVSSSVCLPRLKKSLKEIAEDYNSIRTVSLLDFERAPRSILKKIWNKIGCVKEYDGKENIFSDYYVVATTKPMMFLWGQTLAFDEIIRMRMPPSKYARTVDNKWTFTLWYNVMTEFKDRIQEMPDFIELCRKICLSEFGNDEIVPYGQLIDLYYWIGGKNL